MRHRWKVKDGIASCMNCPLVVKEYRIKMGGLPKCVKQKSETPKDVYIDALVICPKCKNKVPNTIFCVYCAVQLHPLGWMNRG